jgi:hypothetical protein
MGARTVVAAASADQQHELPAHVTVLADAVRLRDLGEWEGLRDREREAPGLDQLADVGDRVDRAAVRPAAERHPVLLRATEVGDRHDVLRAARELDEFGQDAAPGDVERHVDAVGRKRANPLDEALAVGDGLGAQRAQVIMVGGTGGADHARAARHGELDGGAADPTGGAVDEQRAPGPDAERVQAARGRLDGDGQPSGLGEAKRWRDRRVVGEQRQLGRARAVVGEAEHSIADGDVRHALTDLVGDARHLATRRLRELPAHQALAQLPVGRIDAGRAYSDPDLARPHVRIRKIHDLEDLWAPELAEAGCLHHSLRSRPRGVALRSSRPLTVNAVC